MSKKSGFTLLELMFTIALVAIILTIGIPSFQSMMRNNRAIVNTNDFISSLNLARSEANKRGRRVVLCKSDKIDSIAACTTSGDCCTTGTGNWENGWIVFVDLNNNAKVDTDDTVLRVHGPLNNGDTLQ